MTVAISYNLHGKKIHFGRCTCTVCDMDILSRISFLKGRYPFPVAFKVCHSLNLRKKEIWGKERRREYLAHSRMAGYTQLKKGRRQFRAENEETWDNERNRN